MKISTEHGKIEGRLRRSWRQRLKADPKALKRSRQKRSGFQPSLQVFNQPFFYRLVAFCLAFIPFEGVWMIALLLATLTTLFRSLEWASRGGFEAILDLYGGSDTAILNLSRRWLISVALWSVLDSTFYLVLWWLMDRIPLWTVFLGIPCYVFAATISPILVSYFIPRNILARICGSIFFIYLGAMIFFHGRISSEMIQILIGILGILTPSGWVVLMLHDLLAGKVIILYLVGPLLCFAAALAWFIFPIQRSRLLENIRLAPLPGGKEGFEEGDFEEIAVEKREASDKSSISEELAIIRERKLSDYPYEFLPKPDYLKQAAWTSIFVLGVALLVRMLPPLFLKDMRYVFLGATLMGMHVIWFPLLGETAWFSFVRFSQSKVVSVFALFPVPFRKLFISLMKAELRRCIIIAPFAIALGSLALLIAVPEKPWAAPFIGLSLTFFVLINIPLVWFHKVLKPFSNRPFGVRNIFHGSLVVVMLLVFIVEIIFACTFPYLLYTQMEEDTYLFCLFFLMPGLVNAGLAMLGIYSAFWAYEGLKVDLIKSPPRT